MQSRGYFTSRPDHLKSLDHSLLGAVLYGLNGFIIEVQARAVEALDEPIRWRQSTRITGMARGAVFEALDRISGAFAKYQIPEPQVEILINLAPADLDKEGTWLDLPLAIIMLQAAGMLPDLKRENEETIVLTGELGLHGELRRVPGVLSLAFAAKAGQTLIVPAGNEKECSLITAMSTHKGCRVGYATDLLQVINFFKGAAKLHNALGQKFDFTSAINKAPNFAAIRGQAAAKRGAVIAAAGGHNLLMCQLNCPLLRS